LLIDKINISELHQYQLLHRCHCEYPLKTVDRCQHYGIHV